MSNEEIKKAPDGQRAGNAPAPKRKGKKGIIAGAVVVAVIAVGAGLWAWHNTPGFCGTVCHESMNAYVETYGQQAGRAGADKYGNGVANTDAMLVVSHQDDDLACLDCHVPSIAQQLGEVQETLTGDYYVVARAGGEGKALREVDTEGLVVNAGGRAGTADSFCLRSGCHVDADGQDYTRETLTGLTSDKAFNPHGWKHGEIQCSDCHKSHRASVLYCTRCHYDAEDAVPDGWLTYEEGRQILESPLVG